MRFELTIPWTQTRNHSQTRPPTHQLQSAPPSRYKNISGFDGGGISILGLLFSPFTLQDHVQCVRRQLRLDASFHHHPSLELEDRRCENLPVASSCIQGHLPTIRFPRSIHHWIDGDLEHVFQGGSTGPRPWETIGFSLWLC